MIIKSFEEVKRIISDHPEAKDVGYVVTPQLLIIAIQLGMFQYRPVLDSLLTGSVFSSVVPIIKDAKDEDIKETEQTNKKITQVNVRWEGMSLRLMNETFYIGLKRIIEDIELALSETQIKF